MMNKGASESLCCHKVSLGGQHSNTSDFDGNTAGNTAATQTHKAASLLELARNRLGNTRATQAEKGWQHKAPKTPPCVATLSNDFKLVSTWWEWSADDLETFRTWAKQNNDEAAQWIHQEAETARHRRDHLHVENVTESIRPR